MPPSAHWWSRIVCLGSRSLALINSTPIIADRPVADVSRAVVMEFADAGSLDDVIRRSMGITAKGVPERELGSITLQMLYGLMYLHREMKQVHRDLKPANCMLTRKGCVKLSDFGISKQLEATSALASTQCGTTQYMSPERLAGDNYSFVSDVWSVGVVVLEALLGRSPYPSANSFMTLMAAICDAEPPKVPDAYAPSLQDFVAQCLRKNAAARPTVQALIQSAWLQEHTSSDAGASQLGPWLEQLLAGPVPVG